MTIWQALRTLIAALKRLGETLFFGVLLGLAVAVLHVRARWRRWRQSSRARRHAPHSGPRRCRTCGDAWANTDTGQCTDCWELSQW